MRVAGAEMTDTETRSLTEMEVGTGGGAAVMDLLHLSPLQSTE